MAECLTQGTLHFLEVVRQCGMQATTCRPLYLIQGSGSGALGFQCWLWVQQQPTLNDALATLSPACLGDSNVRAALQSCPAESWSAAWVDVLSGQTTTAAVNTASGDTSNNGKAAGFWTRDKLLYAAIAVAVVTIALAAFVVHRRDQRKASATFGSTVVAPFPPTSLVENPSFRRVVPPSSVPEQGLELSLIGKEITTSVGPGIVRFVGYHAEAAAPRVGVELFEPIGRSNGTVNGYE